MEDQTRNLTSLPVSVNLREVLHGNISTESGTPRKITFIKMNQYAENRSLEGKTSDEGKQLPDSLSLRQK